MPKIIRILNKDHGSMKIFCTFPTINISKLNFWLVICIAKVFIWATLKGDFLNTLIYYFFYCPKYCPILRNHTSMESLFIPLSDYVTISISKKLTLMTGFVVLGHISERRKPPYIYPPQDSQVCGCFPALFPSLCRPWLASMSHRSNTRSPPHPPASL